MIGEQDIVISGNMNSVRPKGSKNSSHFLNKGLYKTFHAKISDWDDDERPTKHMKFEKAFHGNHFD